MLNASFLCLVAAALAGVASTLLELSWLRAAAAALPGTVPAAAVVVPAFFGAWTAGAAVAGRLMDRTPSRLGLAARWLAASAGAVLAVPWLAGGLQPEGVPVGWMTRLLVGGLPVVPAAFGLGGALPLLARLRSAAGCPPERATGGVAMAVALGGAAGCAAWVPLMLSDPSPTRLAGAALAAGALVCWLLQVAQRGGAVVAGERLDATALPVDPAAEAPGHGRWMLVAAAAVGGLLLVGGQLAALRLSAQIHGDSVATTAEIIGGVHVGMALGAALLWFSWRPLPTPALVGLLLCVAGAGLVLPARVTSLLAQRPGWETALLLTVPLGVGAGSIVTAASRAVGRSPGRFGAWVGDLAAWSTLGGVLGSLLYGAVLERPELGTGGLLRGLWLLASAAALALGLVALVQRARVGSFRLAAVPVVLLAAAAMTLGFTTPRLAMPWQLDDSERLVEQREGPYGVVSLVTTDAGELRLKLDNRFGLGGSSGVLLEQRMGRVASAMAPDAERVLVLGLGRGHTLAGVSSSTRARIDCVERNAQVLGLGLDVPFLTGAGPGGEPALHHADARAWIDAHRGAYDLVVGDLFYPWVTGAGELLTLEHFEAVSQALAADGVFVQWLPLHQLPWPGFGAVVNAFLEVFPTARLVLATPLASVPIVALVGGLPRGLPYPAALDELFGAFPSPVGPHVAGDVYDLYVADAWNLSTAFRDEPMNRRSHPVSELGSLRRQDDEDYLARTNMRLLADLVTALDTSSLSRTPSEARADRQLGTELQARSKVLHHLLLARAGQLALSVLAADVDAGLRPAWTDERRRLEENLTVDLILAWSAYPGHVAVRSALLERAQELTRARRWDDAGYLLKAAVEIRGDGMLGGVLGGVLVQLGLADDAVRLLEQSQELLPDDRTVLANLAFALLAAGRDGEARIALRAAQAAFAPQPLPPTLAVSLALLVGEQGGEAAARSLLAALEPDSPWVTCLRRLLGGE